MKQPTKNIGGHLDAAPAGTIDNLRKKRKGFEMLDNYLSAKKLPGLE